MKARPEENEQEMKWDEKRLNETKSEQTKTKET